jgi:hypothetical protein
MLYTTKINEASPRANNGNGNNGFKSLTRICHFMSAMMQTHQGKPGYKTSDEHATGVAMYLDVHLNRQLLECITVLVYTRTGTVWPNPLVTPWWDLFITFWHS